MSFWVRKPLICITLRKRGAIRSPFNVVIGLLENNFNNYTDERSENEELLFDKQKWRESAIKAAKCRRVDSRGRYMMKRLKVIVVGAKFGEVYLQVLLRRSM